MSTLFYDRGQTISPYLTSVAEDCATAILSTVYGPHPFSVRARPAIAPDSVMAGECQEVRRADRLFEIIQILRRKKRTRAADLASRLRVSERTIYRDISDMVARGVPIEGEAGVGYIMRPGFDLPPLMFNENEIEALLMGARIVQSWGDPELAGAAATAIDKIGAVSPEPIRKQLDLVRLWAPVGHTHDPITIDQSALRRAVRLQQKVSFIYRDMRDKSTERTVRPLITAFYGNAWYLAGWCEGREGFRVFRIDRMSDFIVLDTRFDREPGRTAEDFLKQDAAQARRADD